MIYDLNSAIILYILCDLPLFIAIDIYFGHSTLLNWEMSLY
jgi:hypothetical protein